MLLLTSVLFVWHMIHSSNSVPVQGMGSGIVVDGEGTILTNHHIIAGASRVAVTLNSGKRLAGSIVGTDQITDIAVIRSDSAGLRVLKLGDSDALRVGQLVIAIGIPLVFCWVVQP